MSFAAIGQKRCTRQSSAQAAAAKEGPDAKRRRKASSGSGSSSAVTPSLGRFTPISSDLLVTLSRFCTEESINAFASSCKSLNALRWRMHRTIVINPKIAWNKIGSARAFFNRLSHLSHFRTLCIPNTLRSEPKAKNIATVIREKNLQIQSLRFGDRVSLQALPVLIGACPHLRTVDFIDALGPYLNIREAILPSLQSCRDLRFYETGPSDVTPEELEEHLKNWTQLETISIGGHYNDKHLLVIARCCPNLRNVRFEWCQDITPLGMLQFVTSCPHLERISVSRFAHFFTKDVCKAIRASCKNFHTLNTSFSSLENAQLIYLKEIGPALTTLKISSRSTTYTDASFKELLPHLPNLRHFSLETCTFNYTLTDATLNDLGKHCKKLRYLFLGGFGVFMHFDRITPEAMLHLISQLPNLEYLGLHFRRLFSNEHLHHLAKAAPNIRFLDLVTESSFSHASMASLIQNLQHLQYLRIPRDQLATLLGSKRQVELFPDLRLLLTQEGSIGFPDQLLRNFGLPTNEL